MDSQLPDRDRGIDALRGLAIAAMVASHLARDVLAAPHPLALRMFGSLAAPLFVALAGLLVAQTAARKHYPLSYYAQRGGVILLLAALVDVLLWGLYPFIGGDVLYLIGIALPLAALFWRLSLAWQITAVAAIALVPSGIRTLWDYPPQVVQVALGDGLSEVAAHGPQIVNQWLWCGWFPLLPWLGFAFLGTWMFRWRQHAWTFRAAGVSLIALGAVCYVWSPTQFHERDGYTELFYPPVLAFLLIASGVVLVLLTFANHALLRDNGPLVRLGRCSLLMYIAHLAILHWAVTPLVGEIELGMYLALYAALMLLLVGLAGAIELGKQRFPRRMPFMLRLILGS